MCCNLVTLDNERLLTRCRHNSSYLKRLSSGRCSIYQPRVARHELPWEPVQPSDQPQRGCIRTLAPGDATPLGLETFVFQNPRVVAPASRHFSPSLQPPYPSPPPRWAGGWNAVGVQATCEVSSESARHKKCSLVLQELFERHADVFNDLAQKHRRNISSLMVRNGRPATVRMPILHVRASLPDKRKAQRLENATDLAGFEDRRLGHRYAATVILWVPTNSASRSGSPSSRSISMTSRRLRCSSSSDSPCE
ncbi:MAG: hypothetical protein QOE70_3952 [Chthoniobacter sp.]|nr:hypothetical protein [Chthoniobacter sp.]